MYGGAAWRRIEVDRRTPGLGVRRVAVCGALAPTRMPYIGGLSERIRPYTFSFPPSRLYPLACVAVSSACPPTDRPPASDTWVPTAARPPHDTRLGPRSPAYLMSPALPRRRCALAPTVWQPSGSSATCNPPLSRAHAFPRTARPWPRILRTDTKPTHPRPSAWRWWKSSCGAPRPHSKEA